MAELLKASAPLLREMRKCVLIQRRAAGPLSCMRPLSLLKICAHTPQGACYHIAILLMGRYNGAGFAPWASALPQELEDGAILGS